MKRPQIDDYPVTDSRTYKNLDGIINWRNFSYDLSRYIDYLEDKNNEL